jgi:hypothetical protein
MSNTLRDKIADIVQEAMWSPASGSVVWTPEKIAKAQEQSGYVADAVLKAIADSGCVIVPKEPDEIQRKALDDYARLVEGDDAHARDQFAVLVLRGYRAMIAASQEARG